MAGDAHFQGRGPDLKPQRSGERLGFTVDARLHRPRRAHVHRVRGPGLPATESVDPTRGLERDEPGDIGRVGDDERDDAEHTFVEVRTAPEAAEPGELVDVVRHEHKTGPVDDHAVGMVDLEVERVGARSE